MHDKGFIFRSFSLFFKYRPWKLITLFFITLVTGFSQGLTLVLLIPLLGLLQPQTPGKSNGWVDFLNGFLGKIGIDVNLKVILLIFAVCLITVAVLNYFKSMIQGTYQQEFSHHIRKSLFYKIINSDWKFLNGKSKHSHIQILTTEVPKMSTYYYFYLDFANKAIFILTHVVLAMMISVSFTLIVLATGMVIFLLLGKYIRRADNLGSAGIKNFRDMLKRIDDFWLSVKIAKVHNSERFYYKKFRQANDRMLDIQNGLTRSKAVPALLFSIAGLLTLILFVYIAYQILHIPVPSIFILILLFSRIFPQFSTINNNINTMVSLQSSVRLVLDVRGNLKIKDPDGENESVNADAGTGRRVKITDKIELLNVSFSYEKDSEPVLENFSAVIPAFKITGITGDSGEGKTTLLDIIAGLLEPSKGCVLADGKQISVNPTAWKQGIGYLPQDSFFIDGTIRDNLIWDTPGQISDATIMDVLDSVNASDLILRQPQGLDTYISNYTYHFSGGERQRLALARVLLRKPVLLLLDEATSSLDTKNENSIMELLHALKKKMTIVLITHRTELSGYFDNVIKL